MRRIAPLAGLALLAASACAQNAGSLVEAGRPDDYEPTTEYLASAIDDSTGLSYRFEGTMVFDMLGEEMGGDTPIITGAYDGDRSQMSMDLGAMFENMIGAFADEAGEDMPDELGEMLGGDLTMEMVIDGDVVYVRAPMFETMADLAPDDEVPEVFTTLGDDWAKIDMTAIAGELPSDVAEQLGSGQSMDPSAFLDVLAEAESVEDLGSDFVDGTPVTGMAATVNFGDMIAAQGADTEAAFEDLEGMEELLDELTMDVEVWVDGDGHVRRFSMDMGEGMEALADESGQDLPLGDFNLAITFDFFDYGEDVEIELPAEDEVVDVTDDWVEMMDDLGG